MYLAPSSQEPTAKNPSGPSKRAFFLAKAIAVLGITGGVALHFFGYVTHQSYMRAWGISSSMFPKPLDWIQINGYYTLFERSWTWSSAAFENWTDIAIWCLAGAGCIFLLITVYQWDPAPRKLPFTLPRYLQNLGMSLLTGTFLCFAIPATLSVIALGLALPAIVGETCGKKLAFKDQQAFLSDCSQPEKGYACVEVKQQGNVLTKGYVIDSSPTRIAIFDTNLKKARVLELENTELTFDIKNTADLR